MIVQMFKHIANIYKRQRDACETDRKKAKNFSISIEKQPTSAL